MRNGIIGIASNNHSEWLEFVRAHESKGAIFCLKQDGHEDGTSCVAIATTHTPWTPPVIINSTDKKTWAIVIGEAFYKGKPLKKELLQHGIQERNSEFASKLSGLFTLVTWEKEPQRLSIVTDRLATQKVYTFHSGDTIRFSSEIKKLLIQKDIPTAIDPEALAQFLIASHPLDERSLLKRIVVCKPATVNTWTTGEWKERPYWSPNIGVGEDDGLDAWADRLASVIEPSVRSLSADPLLLPLTGGLDSRVIAAFLPTTAKLKIQSCSFGHAHCYDVRYGQRIARSLGIPHKFLELKDDFFKLYLSVACELGDGEVSIEALPMLRLLDATDSGATLLSGYLGDTLSGSRMPDLSLVPGEEAQFKIIWHNYFQKSGFSESQLTTVLNTDLAASVQGTVSKLARNLFDDAKPSNATEKIVDLKLRTRQWRYTSYMSRFLGTAYRFRAPFIDNAVMDTFLSMPLRHRLGQRAYRRILTRHAPRIAAIPETKTHKPVSFSDRLERPTKARIHVNLINTLPAPIAWRIEEFVRALDRTTTNLSGGWLGSHNRDYYVHHEESIRTVNPKWFREWLFERGNTSEYFKADALESIFMEHMSGRQNHATRINNIISFLAWCENIGL